MQTFKETLKNSRKNGTGFSSDFAADTLSQIRRLVEKPIEIKDL